MDQLSLNLGLPAQPESQDSPHNFREFVRVYGAIKTVARALDSYTGVLGQDPALWSVLTPDDTLSQLPRRLYVKSTDPVTPGQMIALYNNGGVLNAKLAQSGVANARGFSTGTHAAGDYIEIILFGLHQYVTGLTPGQMYYLSSGVAGGITSVVGSNQAIGYALSPTRLWFNPTMV